MMRSLTVGIAMSVALVVVSLPGRAGEKKDAKMEAWMKAATPGPEHKLLADMAGTWQAKVKAYFDPKGPPQESTGTMTRTMIMGGRFLQEKFDGKFSNMPFSGMGLIGYDNVAKKFQVAWIDNMGTGMMFGTGTYDPATKTFTNVSDYADPFIGKMVKGKDVLKVLSKDQQQFEMYKTPPGGQEFRVMEITYTRKK